MSGDFRKVWVGTALGTATGSTVGTIAVGWATTSTTIMIAKMAAEPSRASVAQDLQKLASLPSSLEKIENLAGNYLGNPGDNHNRGDTNCNL